MLNVSIWHKNAQCSCACIHCEWAFAYAQDMNFHHSIWVAHYCSYMSLMIPTWEVQMQCYRVKGSPSAASMPRKGFAVTSSNMGHTKVRLRVTHLPPSHSILRRDEGRKGPVPVASPSNASNMATTSKGVCKLHKMWWAILVKAFPTFPIRGHNVKGRSHPPWVWEHGKKMPKALAHEIVC